MILSYRGSRWARSGDCDPRNAWHREDITLRALCHYRKVRNRFKDGVFVIRMGANAVLQTFPPGLNTAVAISGGRNLASDIAQSKSLESATTAALKLFVNHNCLFLLDDVWSKPVDGTAFFEALSRICEGGKDSALVFFDS